MSSLLLLRHGQANFAGTDYDTLSPLGQSQARATGAFLAARVAKFDRILVGPRKRHAQTADLTLEAFAARPAIETVHALDEFADGNHLLRMARSQFAAQHGDALLPPRQQLTEYANVIRSWARGEIKIDGCPDVPEFHRRVRDWLADLRAQTQVSQHMLAVSSAGTIAMLVCIALDLPLARCADLMLAQGNAALSEIAFSGTRLGLRSFNSTAHLMSELQSLI